LSSTLTGFIADSEEGMAAALCFIDDISNAAPLQSNHVLDAKPVSTVAPADLP
jgi:hypothetical protein